MEQKVIDLNLKRKVIKLRKHPEFRVLKLNFEKILIDISFFKKNNKVIQKSEIIFKKLIKKNRNYVKSISIQQDFVEEFRKMG
ncbi:MAG: hypothetical protein PHE78_04925 [Candidatus Gastranaerophilales bacterium]|nr:hypothetical protein [Candidatus Gastranaerophilales bacterium]